MAQIFDRSPRQGCDNKNKEAMSGSRGGFEHKNKKGEMTVPWAVITVEMAHDWLVWNEVILGSGYNEMKGTTAPYNQKKLAICFRAVLEQRGL